MVPTAGESMQSKHEQGSGAYDNQGDHGYSALKMKPQYSEQGTTEEDKVHEYPQQPTPLATAVPKLFLQNGVLEGEETPDWSH
mmetsp:Transcript_84399/g.148156  ORF Transcript_84399/g.148156 Transcript_84399/m.148156 type:complete len:83 (+) Transcript_84399:754-1002(+)